MDNILSLLGLAKKAGRLEMGEAPVASAAKSYKARLILVASDTAENSLSKVERLTHDGRIPLVILPHTKSEVGLLFGRASCALLAVTDIGFAANLANKLALLDPQQYGPAAAALEQAAQRTRDRLHEKQAHEKKLQRVKARVWATPAKGKDPRKSR